MRSQQRQRRCVERAEQLWIVRVAAGSETKLADRYGLVGRLQPCDLLQVQVIGEVLAGLAVVVDGDSVEVVSLDALERQCAVSDRSAVDLSGSAKAAASVMWRNVRPGVAFHNSGPTHTCSPIDAAYSAASSTGRGSRPPNRTALACRSASMISSSRRINAGE